jgi:hypothetical protein
MRNVRTMMLKGEKPASCLKCYKEEESGHLSKRNWETEYWSKRYDISELIRETDDQGNIPTKIRYIDLRLGSKCQLACVMCSPHDSSNWIPEWNKLYPLIQNKNLKQSSSWNNKGLSNGSSYNWHKNNPQFWKDLFDQIPNMYQLYFAGGESLIIDEHYDLLEACIKLGYAKNIELRYNSNAVEWREDLFDLWKHFKLVRFHYSVDSIGEMNHYIRYPSTWERTKEVFHILDKQTGPNVEVTVACAVQALNIYYLPDFLKWKLEEGFTKINMWPFGAGGINYHFVYHPPHLNVKVLPAWFKAECRKKYEEFYPWWEANWELGVPSWHKGKVTYDQWRTAEYGIDRLEGMLKFMESEDWSNRLVETKEYLDNVDSVRNLSFANTFPEMKDIFNGK